MYSSVVWSGIIRYREAQCNVLYPSEVDDEMFDNREFYSASGNSPLIIGPSPSRGMESVGSSSWLCGWNFTTDLYRILEHAMDNFRTRRARLQRKSFLSEIFGDRSPVSPASVSDKVMRMYANLPQIFKSTPPITRSPKQDRFGFQAANIMATIQLLRMVLFTAQGATADERCQIASQVIDSFLNIPVGYLNAISSPLLHHLAGIGSILGSVFEEPLSEPEYQRVRSVLLTLAQLLANLDLSFSSTGTASERVISQVARIDEYMAAQRTLPGRSHPPMQVMGPARSEDFQSLEAGSLTEQPATGVQRQCFAQQGSPIQLPADLLDDWSWVFDFSQPAEWIDR